MSIPDDIPPPPEPDPELADKLLLQHCLERTRELEGWLAMMVAMYGHKNSDGPGYTFRLSGHNAEEYRSVLGGELNVDIHYDLRRDCFIITAL